MQRDLFGSAGCLQALVKGCRAHSGTPPALALLGRKQERESALVLMF